MTSSPAFIVSAPTVAAPRSHLARSSFVHATSAPVTVTTRRHATLHAHPRMSASSNHLRSYRRALLNLSSPTPDTTTHHEPPSASPLAHNQSASPDLPSSLTRALSSLAATLRRVRTVLHDPKYARAFLVARVAVAAFILFTTRLSPVTSTASSTLASIPAATPSPIASILKPFSESFGVVFLSEFGDKSMFATALMAMKYNPLIVCVGAFAALTIMTFIACFLGQLMHLLPATVTHYSSIALFVFFGIQMLLQARNLPDTPGGAGSERADAEELVTSGGNTLVAVGKESSLNVLVKVASLIFVAEWCDRSMLATMALAASSNTVAVIGGATLANIVCTGFAVCAASIVASKISERMVAIIAGVLFEVFAVFTFFEGPEA